MKIIVAQRFDFTIKSIKRDIAEVDESVLSKIHLTCDPLEVVRIVSDYESAIVISSQVYDGATGTELAGWVKQKNPNALFYIFSHFPEVNECVDGVIPKRPNNDVLVKMLCSDLSGATRESLMQYAK